MMFDEVIAASPGNSANFNVLPYVQLTKPSSAILLS